MKGLKRKLPKSSVRVAARNSWFKEECRRRAAPRLSKPHEFGNTDYDFIFDATGRRRNRASRENRADVTAARDIQSDRHPIGLMQSRSQFREIFAGPIATRAGGGGGGERQEGGKEDRKIARKCKSSP